MDQLQRTSKEISELRKAFKIQYESFRKNYYDLGIRFYELTKQADLLLKTMEELNKIELDLDKLVI